MSYIHEAAFLSSERAGKVAQAGVGVGGPEPSWAFQSVSRQQAGERARGVSGAPSAAPRQVGFLLSDLAPGGPPGTLEFAAVTAANKHSRVCLSRMFSELEFERCFPFSQPTPSVLRLWLSQQDSTVRGQGDGLSPQRPRFPPGLQTLRINVVTKGTV